MFSQAPSSADAPYHAPTFLQDPGALNPDQLPELYNTIQHASLKAHLKDSLGGGTSKSPIAPKSDTGRRGSCERDIAAITSHRQSGLNPRTIKKTQPHPVN